MDFEQISVNIKFIHDNLDVQIYLEKLEGSSDNEHDELVCKLRWSLYSLKQLIRQWYKNFDSYML